MSLLKTGACFTSELELNCPTIVGCVTALPVGPAGVAGTTQVLGKDGQFHALPAVSVPALSVSGSQLTITGGNTITLPDNDTQDLSISGNVISLTNGGSITLPTTAAPTPQVLSVSGNVLSLTNGGSITLPAAVTFATPAETVVGTSTTLAVNPADLFARENIAAQTGVSNNLSAIPAPTAGQSNWAVNLLGETLHYAPGLGWKIVTDLFGDRVTIPGVASIPANAVVQVGALLTMPRAGRITVTAQVNCSGNPAATTYNRPGGGILFNGVAITSDNTAVQFGAAGFWSNQSATARIFDVVAGDTVGAYCYIGDTNGVAGVGDGGSVIYSYIN